MLNHTVMTEFCIRILIVLLLSGSAQVVDQLTKDTFGASSIIFIDIFYWFSEHTTEMDRKKVLVHELRHQYDFQV